MKRRKQKKKIIKSNLSKIGIVLSFEQIFRRRDLSKKERKRGEKIDHRKWTIDDGIIKNDRSTADSLKRNMEKRSKDFFPTLSLYLSLSLCVCVIDRSKCGLKILNTYDEFYYEASLLCTGRWRKSDGAVVSVVRGGVRRVSWLCFFSEPVRHPSRRSAGH